jgi:hypothetical protein
MKLFDLHSPFFLPLYRRVIAVAFTGGWAALELASGNTGWALIFAAGCAFCWYEFFFAFDPENFKKNKKS